MRSSDIANSETRFKPLRLHPLSETLDLSDSALVVSFQTVSSWRSSASNSTWELVVESRMRSASIIDVFDEGADMDFGLFDRRVEFAVHFLFLQRAHQRSALAVGLARPRPCRAPRWPGSPRDGRRAPSRSPLGCDPGCRERRPDSCRRRSRLSSRMRREARACG